jgi:FMN reductase
MQDMTKPVHVVGIGGTLRANSSTERTLRVILGECERLGASTTLLCGPDIDLPTYAPERLERTEAAVRLVEELRRADAIVLGSPGYHGGVSGLVKNAIDYVEDLRGDKRVYFDGRAVACVATGAGWQGTAATLSALRGIVHALRGWPTPLGVALNSSQPLFDSEGACLEADLRQSLHIVAAQLVEFARRW